MRSQLIRDALEALLSLRECQCNEAALAVEGTAMASDPDECQEALVVAQEFLEVENEGVEWSWWW